MIHQYIVVEGQNDVEILKRILPKNLVDSTKFVVGSGQYGAQSMARSLAATREGKIALIIDADTIDVELIREKQTHTQQFMRGAERVGHIQVFMPAPTIEVVFLEDSDFIYGLMHNPFPSDKYREHYPDNRMPKEILTEILGQKDWPSTFNLLLKRLDEISGMPLLGARLVQDLNMYFGTEEVQQFRLIGPSRYLEVVHRKIDRFLSYSGLYYGGIIDNISATTSPQGSDSSRFDEVRLHLRSGVERYQGKTVILHLLREIAEEEGITVESRNKVVLYEDNYGEGED